MSSAPLQLSCRSLEPLQARYLSQMSNISRKHGIISKHVGILMLSLLLVELGVFGNRADDARGAMFVSSIE
jgi:hypothetical protein